MTQPDLAVKGGIVAGTAMTAALDQIALSLFGIPIAAVTAACTAALLPSLLTDPEPLGKAVRRWCGSVFFSLLLTALVTNALGLHRGYSIGVAAILAMFARDLFAGLIGQVPPLLSGLRERLTGERK